MLYKQADATAVEAGFPITDIRTCARNEYWSLLPVGDPRLELHFWLELQYQYTREDGIARRGGRC